MSVLFAAWYIRNIHNETNICNSFVLFAGIVAHPKAAVGKTIMQATLSRQ